MRSAPEIEALGPRMRRAAVTRPAAQYDRLGVAGTTVYELAALADVEVPATT